MQLKQRGISMIMSKKVIAVCCKHSWQFEHLQKTSDEILVRVTDISAVATREFDGVFCIPGWYTKESIREAYEYLLSKQLDLVNIPPPSFKR